MQEAWEIGTGFEITVIRDSYDVKALVVEVLNRFRNRGGTVRASGVRMQRRTVPSVVFPVYIFVWVYDVKKCTRACDSSCDGCADECRYALSC
jgi:hypothetical protein